MAAMDTRGADRKAEAIRRARELLAGQLGTAEARVVVQSAEPAQWPDASLGCPEKGMQYAQVLTSGYRVLATIGGREYEVHVAGSRAVLCPSEVSVSKPGAADRSLERVRVSDAARADLAIRLGLEPRAIKVKVIRSGVAGKTCPADGQTKEVTAPGPASGTGGSYEIELIAQDRVHRYQVHQGHVHYCGPAE